MKYGAYCFVADGRHLPITNMFDVDGEETDLPGEAHIIVAEMLDGRWLASECREGDIVPSDRLSS